MCGLSAKIAKISISSRYKNKETYFDFIQNFDSISIKHLYLFLNAPKKVPYSKNLIEVLIIPDNCWCFFHDSIVCSCKLHITQWRNRFRHFITLLPANYTEILTPLLKGRMLFPCVCETFWPKYVNAPECVRKSFLRADGEFM